MKTIAHFAHFANSSSMSHPTLLVEISNELKVGEDGWAQIAPLGDFPGMALIDDGNGGFKKVKAIQRIDAAAVANMVNSYNAARGGITRFLKGAPIYNGHPDIPGYERRYPDKSPKGVFAAVKDGGAQGFMGEPIFTNEGEQLIASRKVRGLSGRWSAEEVGEENGTKIYRPKEFISAGLTDRPNLPVQLLNEKENLAEGPGTVPGNAEAATNQPMNSMKKKLIAVCTLLGIQFANDADDAATETALDQIHARVNGFASTLKTIKTRLGTICTAAGITFANDADDAAVATAFDQLGGKVTLLVTERDTARTDLTSAQSQFANERTARIDRELSLALGSGRITKAEEADWKRRLGIEAQFANELEALGKLAPKVKTESITIERGGKKVELANEAERTTFVNELVAEEMKGNQSLTAETAFARVEKKYPQLFAAMKHPAIKMPRK
jgi:hypothetical protein